MALKTCVLAGMGSALLANWMVDDDIAQDKLVNLFPEYAVAATNFETAAWIIYLSRHYLPSKVRTLIDFTKSK